MAHHNDSLPAPASTQEVASFLRKVREMPVPVRAADRGRLLFAMDATASRQPSWDRACHIQAQMFEQTLALGGLEVQLCFFRGLGECKAGPWVSEAPVLQRQMAGVRCLGGLTQIHRVLSHAIDETARRRIHALVYVGDCMEEDPQDLAQAAGRLGMLGVPAFLFHEGLDPAAAATFRRIAALTGGAYCRFDATSPGQLRDLLSAVAIFAAGGRTALQAIEKHHGGARLLLAQLPGGGKNKRD